MAYCGWNCVLACLLLVSSLVERSHTFHVESFCASRCSRGRGGNLCQCSGFHFAGKRSGLGYDPSRLSDDLAAWAIEPQLLLDKIRRRRVNSEDNIDTNFKNSLKSHRKNKVDAILERLFSDSLLEARSRHRGDRENRLLSK